MVGNWRSGNYGPKDHEARLLLDPELVIARTKIQMDYDISPLYAGLVAFTVGCNTLKKLSDEECQRLMAKYTIPVNQSVKRKREVLTPEAARAKSELEGKDRFFKNVLTQWNEHPAVDWQVKMFTIAEKWKDKLQSARDILAKDISKPKMEDAT